MLSTFIVSFRETLEAALIIGIILAYLSKTGATKLNRHVYAGAALGVLASAITAVAFETFAGGFTGKAEQLFEGVTMLLAAAVLTYVIFWMASAKQFTQRIERKVNANIATGSALGLLALSFFAVYREGVELVLLVGASLFASSGGVPFAEVAAGTIAAVAVGYAAFKTALRFQLKTIFSVTSLLLVVFAAGLAAHGVHEFQEAGVLPEPYGKVWDTSKLLDEDGAPGQFAKALFGYAAQPTEFQVGAYFGYLAVAGLAYALIVRKPNKPVASKVR